MRIILGILALVVGISGANAADLKNSVKDVTVTSTSTPNPFAGVYGGVTLGGQITDFNVSDGHSNDILGGIAAEGLVYGGHAGYNFTLGEIVAGPYVEFAWSNVAVSVLGEDVLKLDNYTQIGGMIGARTSSISLISAHIGYEWDNWTFGNRKLEIDKTDVDATAWVFGIGFDTMVTSNVSLGLVVDYVAYDGAEVDNHKLDAYLEGSDAIRATARLSYRPGATLPSLDSVKF